MDSMYVPPPPAPPPVAWPDPPPPPPAPLQQPPAHRSPGFWLAVTGAVVVVLSAGGVGIAALAHHIGGTPATTSGTAPASSRASDAAWVSTVSTDATGLGSDFITLGDDASAENEGAASADCQAILTEITIFQSDIRPIPPDYATAGATLVQALQTYTEACDTFMSGIADQNVSDLDTASTEMITGTSLLHQVTLDIAGRS